MTDSSRSHRNKSRTAIQSPSVSPVTIILFTALDTTWRVFAPVLIAVWAGIGLDHLLNSAPVATIICLIIGAATSLLLIVRQLKNVRRDVNVSREKGDQEQP